jgi:type IV secretory pathway VirB6-like protein
MIVRTRRSVMGWVKRKIRGMLRALVLAAVASVVIAVLDAMLNPEDEEAL